MICKALLEHKKTASGKGAVSYAVTISAISEKWICTFPS